MSDLPPPTPPSDPGGFGPPGSAPPPPPGWPPSSGGPPSGTPIPYQSPPPQDPWWKKKFAAVPVLAWLILLAAGLGTGLFFLLRSDDEKTAPPVTAPEVTNPDQPSIPEITVPDITLPDLTIPDITLPDITLPDITLPDITIPDITIPDITIPDISIPEISIPDSGNAAKDLSLVDSWFFRNTDLGDSYEWGAIVDNTGTTAYEFVTVSAEFYDDGGRLVGSETGFLSNVQPGKNITTGLFASPPAPATRLEAKVEIDKFVTRPSDAPTGTLTADQLAVANITDFSFDVTGQLTSTFPADVKNLQVVGLWRDANGAVIASSTAYVDRVPVGTPTLFSMNVFSDTLERILPGEIYFAFS